MTSDRVTTDQNECGDALAEALYLLGLRSDCSLTDARAVFRRMVTAHHPDLHEGDAVESERTRMVIVAFRLVERDLQARGAVETRSTRIGEKSDPGSAATAVVRKIDADTLSLVATAEEAYARLVEVGHLIGDVTYIDRQNGLFESLLKTVHGDAVSMVCTLQGRADETIEAFFTMEPIGIARGELPDIDGVTDLIAHHLIARW